MTLYLLKISVFIALILVVLVAVFVRRHWAPERTVAELERWQLPNSEFISVQGMRVHVVQSNKCQAYQSDETTKVTMATTAADDSNSSNISEIETIVLLHGTSASLHTWEGWTAALVDRYCVVSMDLPGFGLTGPYTDERTAYNSENYAAFVIEVLDQLKLNKVTLAGNSLGGKIAWRTAALYPERVNRLILVNAVGYPTTPKQVPIGFKLAKYPVMTPILRRILPRNVVKDSVLSVYADKNKVDEALIDRYYELSLRQGNRQALGRRLSDTDDERHQEQIKQLSLPTLILWGAKDNLIPVENAALFHRDIRDSQLVIFDDLGHVPHEEDPAATVQIVKQFLAKEEVSDEHKQKVP